MDQKIFFFSISTLVCGTGVAQNCLPGLAPSGPNNAISTGPENTAFPTSHRNAKVQYLYLASELADAGLCAGDVNSLDLMVLDDDVVNPAPGSAVNIEVTLGHTTTSSLSVFDTGISALPPQATLQNFVIGAGVMTFMFSTPFTWDGVSNLIVEICLTRGTVVGLDPRIELTDSLPFNATRYGYDPFAYLGCDMTETFPATATRGVLNSRAAIRFSGSVQPDCLGVPNGTALPGTPCDDGIPGTITEWDVNCDCVLSATGMAVYEGDLSSVRVHPVPARDLFTMELTLAEAHRVDLEVLDLLGQVVLTRDLGIQQGRMTYALDLGGAPSGSYLLRVRTGDSSIVRRLVKH